MAKKGIGRNAQVGYDRSLRRLGRELGVQYTVMDATASSGLDPCLVGRDGQVWHHGLIGRTIAGRVIVGAIDRTTSELDRKLPAVRCQARDWLGCVCVYMRAQGGLRNPHVENSFLATLQAGHAPAGDRIPINVVGLTVKRPTSVRVDVGIVFNAPDFNFRSDVSKVRNAARAFTKRPDEWQVADNEGLMNIGSYHVDQAGSADDLEQQIRSLANSLIGTHGEVGAVAYIPAPIASP